MADERYVTQGTLCVLVLAVLFLCVCVVVLDGFLFRCIVSVVVVLVATSIRLVEFHLQCRRMLVLSRGNRVIMVNE